AKRTKHVEHSSQAKLAPRDAGETKRRVKHRRKQESDPGLVNAASDTFRGKVDLHAQLLEHVRRAAHRRRRAVAVLGDARAASGSDDRLYQTCSPDPSPRSGEGNGGAAARRTKLPRIFLPSFVRIDSGWNCTP